MKKLKIFNIELEGIDKCGKDLIAKYIFELAPGKYLCRARGLISQLAYNELYKRDFAWNASDYHKNTLFVLLNVDKEDWKIRCKTTNEPDAGCTYEEHVMVFRNAFNSLISDYDVYDEQILAFNTSKVTPYEIAKMILAHLDNLNENRG